MNKKKILMVACLLIASVFARSETIVTVTGDRVSLRAAPLPNAVLLARAALNDKLVLADDSNVDWVGVRVPPTVDLWVDADYVQDGVVLPARLNIRSGPSLSHNVVAIVNRDKKLNVRGTLDGWLRIAPPEEAVVWISRRYTDMASDEEKTPQEQKSEVVIAIQPNEPKPAQVIQMEEPPPESVKVVKTVLQPVINDVMVAAAGIDGLPDVLALDSETEKEQGLPAEFSGILQPANKVLYKLVDPDRANHVLCYVSGKPEQMATYSGCSVTLSGTAYWVPNLDLPVLRPTVINVLSQAAAE